MYFKKFNFPHYQNNCWHADWCQEWNIKTLLLKISKIHLNRWPCFPMQMFLSISGHSSELSIPNQCPRPTVSQLKCISDTISNWFKNHQPQKTKNSTVTNAPFIQNSNQVAFRLTFKPRIKWPLAWLQPQVFRAYFFNSCNFRGNVQVFRLKGQFWR